MDFKFILLILAAAFLNYAACSDCNKNSPGYSEKIRGCINKITSRTTDICDGLHGDYVQDPATCEAYQCVWGEASDPIECPNNTAWNPEINNCDWETAFEPCVSSSPPADTTTTPAPTTTPPTDPPTTNATTPPTNPPTTTPTTKPTTEPTTKAPVTEETTPSAPVSKGNSFIGFVIDETGSMSNEIDAVKTWLTNCVTGSYTDCAIAPTGGWILSSFNDPSDGILVGPTTDLTDITSAIDSLHANGGGDCPERAFSGLLKVVEKVPVNNSDCKIFFFTDAIANDEGYYTMVKDRFMETGCSYIPMLTGCCGNCSSPCDSTDPEYCTNHVVVKTSYSLAASAYERSLSNEELFYDLASSTGGKIYITDKPSSADDFLDFLEEEVTLGFCPTDLIAGPLPNGYTSESDCNSKSSCWDRSQSKCFCMSETEPCPHDPIPDPSAAPTCDPDQKHSWMADNGDCTKYYECYKGYMWNRGCPPGTVFDAEELVCNFPSQVRPPCGYKN